MFHNDVPCKVDGWLVWDYGRRWSVGSRQFAVVQFFVISDLFNNTKEEGINSRNINIFENVLNLNVI